MNIGIIGCGAIGNKRANLLSHPHRLLAACDKDMNKAVELFKNFNGLKSNISFCTESDDELINCPYIDVIIISTINCDLAKIALKAIKQGKHVLVEKPGAISLSELNKMEDALKTSKSLVRFGYNHRYHPACLKAMEIFKREELGNLMFIRGRYGHGGRVGYEKEWRFDKKISGGGELIDQGVHLIDLSGIFLGKFTRVDGHLANYFWESDVEDNAFLTLRDDKNRVAWLHASCTEWKNMFSFEIYGQKGKLHWEGLGGSYGVERLSHYKMSDKMGPPETVIYEFPQSDKSWKLEMDEFFEDIKLNKTPVPGIKEAKAVLDIIETIYRPPTFKFI